MYEETALSRFFGGCGCNDIGMGTIVVIGVILLLLFGGEDLFAWLFCEDMALIWVILIILLLLNFEDGFFF